jgi:5'-3' exoribonuclease 2
VSVNLFDEVKPNSRTSRFHVPLELQKLMTDKDSPIIDFYPMTFEIDMNGKRMAWQGVALLPFIDENRLLEAMQPYYAQATEEEKRRNSLGYDILFVSEHHPLFDFICALYGKRRSKEVRG